MREVEGEIDKPSIIVGDFNISLSGGEKQADPFSNNIYLHYTIRKFSARFDCVWLCFRDSI